MRKKQFVAVLSASVLALSALTGCSSSSDNGDVTTTTAEGASATEGTDGSKDATADATEKTTEGTPETDKNGETVEATEAETLPVPQLDMMSIDASKYVDVSNWKDTKVKAEDVEIDEDAIQYAMLDNMVRQFEIKTEEITDRPVELYDTVIMDYKGTKDGVAFDGGTAEDADLQIGSGDFIPGFEAGMIGMKIGEEKDLDLTFPENYGNAELAGAKVVFHVKVKSIEGIKEVKDEDIKKGSDGAYETFDAYKKDFRDSKVKDAESNAIFDAVMANVTKKEDCKELIDYYIDSNVYLMSAYAQMYGITMEQMAQYAGFDTVDAFKASLQKDAETYAMSACAVRAIADAEGLKVDADEIQKEYDAQVEQYGEEEDISKSDIEFSLLLQKADELINNTIKVEK